MDGAIDYSSYTVAELREAAATVDRRAFPKNFARLQEELHRRHVAPTVLTSSADQEVVSVSTAAPAPTCVRTAVKLLWLSLAVGLTSGVVNWGFMVTLASPVMLVAMSVPALLVMIWLIHKISVGRNWARITLLVLAIVSWPIALGQLPELFRQSFSAALFTIGIALLRLPALVLLFLRPSNAWFRNQRARKFAV